MKGVVYVAMGFTGPPADQAAANKELNEVVDTWVGHFLKGKFVGGDTLCIADFKAVTFLFASMQPCVETKLGYKASDRVKKRIASFSEHSTLTRKLSTARTKSYVPPLLA